MPDMPEPLTPCADLRAALDWLSRRPEVDPARVGVHGGSQALWTLAIATQRGARPAFAVLSGAPAGQRP